MSKKGDGSIVLGPIKAYARNVSRRGPRWRTKSIGEGRLVDDVTYRVPVNAQKDVFVQRRQSGLKTGGGDLWVLKCQQEEERSTGLRVSSRSFI